MTLNFSERRDLLADKVLEDSAIIVSAASVKSRISDTEYSYRQDSNFYYLSGYEEPESLILIRPNQDKERFIIFCRDRDPLREQWDGFRTGQEGVIQDYGADAAYSINSIDEIMPKLLEGEVADLIGCHAQNCVVTHPASDSRRPLMRHKTPKLRNCTLRS